MDGILPCMVYLVSLTAGSAQCVDPFLKVAHVPYNLLKHRVLPKEHGSHRLIVGLQLLNSKLRRNKPERSRLRLTQTRPGRAIEPLLELHHAGEKRSIVESLLENGGVPEPIQVVVVP